VKEWGPWRGPPSTTIVPNPFLGFNRGYVSEWRELTKNS
jgi:hypothetical protein